MNHLRSRFSFPVLRVALCAAALAGAIAAVRSPEESRSPAAPSAPDVSLQPLATGLGAITSIVSAGDGRLFLTIQTGQIRIYSGGTILSTPFLDLSSVISCCVERGRRICRELKM